jgi:type II secretory pathway pseudopilin PulG
MSKQPIEVQVKTTTQTVVTVSNKWLFITKKEVKVNQNEKGFALILEMLCVCAVMLILAAISVPNIVAVTRVKEGTTAKDRVQTFSRIQTTLALCAATPGCSAPVALTAQLPPPGTTIPQGAYLYTFTANPDGTWSYTAAPGQGFAGPVAFVVDQTGIVTCGGVAC